MNFKLMATLFAVVAVAGFSQANAQHCGCGGYGAYAGVTEGAFGGYGGFGNVGYTGRSNCFRGMSSLHAASLWAGYCNEDCDAPERRKLRDRDRHRDGGCRGKRRHGLKLPSCGFGFPMADYGCEDNSACFDYPEAEYDNYDSCDECGEPECDSCRHSRRERREGHGCKVRSAREGCGLKSKLANHGGCGLGGCLSGGCGSDCGCKRDRRERGKMKSKLHNLLHRHRRDHRRGRCLSEAVDSCGCCSGYFDQAIGFEYGNAGMQSYVSGSLTEACGCEG